jgi:hypothetical protein
MTDDNVLFLLADTSKYHEGKVNILTAQSHVLLSREQIKKIKALRTEENIGKNKIVMRVTKLKTDVKRLKDLLPIKKEQLVSKNNKTDKHKHARPIKNEIQHELDKITQKLQELGAA